MVNLKTGILVVIVPVDKIRSEFVSFEENVQYFHWCGPLVFANFPHIVGQFCIEFSPLQQVVSIVLNVDEPVLTYFLQVVLPAQDGLVPVEQPGLRAVKYSRADDVECEVRLAQLVSWHGDLEIAGVLSEGAALVSPGGEREDV